MKNPNLGILIGLFALAASLGAADQVAPNVPPRLEAGPLPDLMGFPAHARPALVQAVSEGVQLREGVPPAPLFRDPVFDGAADPALIWNEAERAWWIFYTNRRANDPQAQDGVRWCHGTDIGIASSADGGLTWTYRGIARGLDFEPGRNTFWAPCLLEHARTYHMFVAYVRGVPADWSGERHIVHYTSRNLIDWKFEGIVPLDSARVIDPFVYPKPTGGWRMWYKDEADGSHLWAADSADLGKWAVKGPVITAGAQEGPAVFYWRGSYWMFADRWQGMAVFRSADLEHWTGQAEPILGVPGTRPDDGDIGRHGEVLVQGDRAFIVYFTHPAGKTEHTQPGKHRSSLQAAELGCVGGRIVCDRNKTFTWRLGPPGGFRPDVRPASALTLQTSDSALAAAFAWAKDQAMDYVFPAAVTGDAVGDWYEAALPGRFAFCMRDVSHQAAGAQALGLARFNANMFRKFAEAIAASRDFCSYWEIDKYNRPAPVDYKSDVDFWYNLPANFDVLDACWRQFLWTGDRTYVDDPAFRNFYERTVGDYVRTWDADGDGIPEERPGSGSRGLGSYDEGPLSDRTMAGSDLLAAMHRAYLSYADMLRFRGGAGRMADAKKDEGSSAATRAAGIDSRASGSPANERAVDVSQSSDEFIARADKLRREFLGKWWSPGLRRFAGLMLQGRKLVFDDQFWYGLFPIYFGIVPAGAQRDSTLRGLVSRQSDGIEVESYLSEVYYRYGEDEAARAEILRLSDPAKKRREYPEVSFAVIGAVASGTFGVEPNARVATVATRPRLTAETAWAELGGLPVFGNVVAVRHNGNGESVFTNISGPALTWKAVLPGRHAELSVDGVRAAARTGKDESGRDVSWVMLKVGPGERRTVKLPPA